MRVIEMYIDLINEELDSAREYAEKYLEYKTSKPQWARMCSEMASDELKHAGYIQDIAQQTADGLSWMPDSTRDDWSYCVGHMGEKIALVKMMLSK